MHFFPTTFLKKVVYTKENGAFRTKEAGILSDCFATVGLKAGLKARKDGFSLLPENNWKRWITSDDASIHQHIVGVSSSNSLATRRGTRNLIYILAFILLILLTTSAYSTSTLLFLLFSIN